MKKIFTLFTLLAMTMAANAQLTFVYNDAPVANGATIVSDKVHEQELVPGVLSLYQLAPGIYLSSEKDGAVTVTAEYVDEEYQICYGEQCQSPAASRPSVSVNGNIKVGEMVDLMIHTPDVQSKDALKTTTVKIAAQYDGDASSKITATFILSIDPTVGIGNVEATEGNVVERSYSIAGYAAKSGLVIVKKGDKFIKVLNK